MRSAQEGRPSLGKVEAAPESLPEVKTKAQSSQAKVSSTDPAVVEGSPSTHTQQSKGPENRLPVPYEKQSLASRVAEAEAWETQAFEAEKRRSSQFRQASIFELEDAPVKQKPSLKKVEVSEKKKSEVVSTRPLWANKAEYIFALVGFSLRPLNLWRFPHLWLHNGGCNFFIIYIFLLFLMGIPLLFLEMAVGRRMRQCSICAWTVMGPWFGGAGYSSVMVCFITALYLNVANGWILFYLGQSFQFSVPWERCPLLKNSSGFDPECARTTPSMYFWYRLTLKASDSIEERGPPVISLLLPLLMAWCLVGIFMINGIKSTGKVLCVLVPLAGIITISLLIRSVLLTGARYGLQRLTVMKVSAMYSITAWIQAGIQVLFALGLGFGPVVIYSSYMDQPNNCLSDAFVVAFINLGFSILAMPFILSVLGFWATVLIHSCIEKNAELLLKLVVQGKLPPEALPPINIPDDPHVIFTSWLNSLSQPIKNLVLSHITECNLEKQFLKVKEGLSFAFLAFIEAMSFISGSVFWSILFFLLLLLLEMGFMIGLLQGVMTPLQDTFPFCKKHEKLLTVVLFGLMFLCSIFFIQPAGVYYIKLLSDYWMVLPIIVIVISENMAVSWAYGSRRFLAELGPLWSRPIHPIFHCLWCCACPFVLLVLFTVILIFLSLKTFTYVAWDSSTSKEVPRPYPSWALLVMVFIFLIVTLPILIYFVYSFAHGIPFKPRSLEEPLRSSKSQSLSNEAQKKETPQGDFSFSGHLSKVLRRVVSTGTIPRRETGFCHGFFSAEAGGPHCIKCGFLAP
ncbi:PREDICTED: orphan sodium- and chloride-dependent neurotransmitter transporter NTT5 [Myotis brandtii]|uniref:orphan sodium- and chloride-dependent neurotransmitter transporter NTT5 n=1 Tax=Myotis brandtii TaxID=109478 RepID=UPI000703FBE5|nr:PREDICTED: orphan sodium- and chloride-dependent neurotransmitter transporter NTT5 [Myotis brandtii]